MGKVIFANGTTVEVPDVIDGTLVIGDGTAAIVPRGQPLDPYGLSDPYVGFDRQQCDAEADLPTLVAGES